MQNLIFILQTLSIIFREFIYYLFNRPKIKCFIHIITHLGNLNIFYIKIFQSLSTNSYLLNNEQISYLTSYTDKVPYTLDELDFSFIESIKNLSEDLGQDFELDTIDGKIIPYRAGMIAIVYTGKINNKKIIIKVIRKGIRKKIKKALRQINFLINIFAYAPYIKRYNFKNLILDNEKLLLSQTNFISEIQNIKRMHENCKNTDYIVIPYVYENYTYYDKNIIVMDYIEGERLEKVTDLDKDNYSLLVAKYGLKCLLFNRFYHGDLHAGNILFIRDEENNHKLGILDFGVCGELTREEQNEFYKLFVLIGKTDNYIDVAEFIIDNLVESKETIACLKEIERKDIIIAISLIAQQTFSNIGFGAAELYEISKLLDKYNLSLARNFCKVELALAISNSVSAKLTYKTSYIKNIKHVLKDITTI